jgi:predicted MPP superfamily phosphohydrolase
MTRFVSLLGFFAFGLSIVGGLHYYLWARLVRDTALPLPYARAATLALWILFLQVPLAFFLSRAGRFRILSWPAFVWMGLFFLLFVSVLGTDLIRGVLEFARAVDPDRRQFLQRVFGIVSGGTGAILGAVAVREALSRVEVVEVEIPLARLPKALDRTTIVQLSDLHIGPMLGRRFLEDLTERTNALEPDLVVITGDLVDGSVDELRNEVAAIAGLRARHGVFFVTGNHEYYSGASEWIMELERLGIRVLRNERVSIGDHEASFDLAGVDDLHALGMAPGHGPDLPRALANRDSARELVLLAHQPKQVHEAARHGVGLQLSGHTHGGQIWPFNYLVRLQQPYTAGLVKEGPTHLYISRGTGYWGPPMRLGAPAEITRLTLRAIA